MPSRLKFLIVILAAIATAPAIAACPDAPTTLKGEIGSVEDVFRFQRRHPGQRIVIDRATLERADFSGRNVSRICFKRSNLKGSNWARAKGYGAAFFETDLTGSNWRGFRGRGVRFDFATLDQANLAGASLRRVKFRSTAMEGVDASGADLSGGSLEGSSLYSFKGASFLRANLSRFAFRCGIGQEDNCGSDSTDVSLAGANLTGATWSTGFKSEWDLRGAIIANTRMHLGQMWWLHASRIAGPVIVEPASWTAAQSMTSRGVPSAVPRTILSRAEVKAVLAAMARSSMPGFDCDRAASASERLICTPDPGSTGIPGDRYFGFALVDRELNAAYSKAWRRDRSVVVSQRQWLRERDACMNVRGEWVREDCLLRAYRHRIETLWQVAGMNATLGRGERRWYADEQTAGFIAEIVDPKLRAKLARAALWNAWQVVLIERDRRGRLSASGESIGANYHLGSLTSPDSGMVFDSASGFYGGAKPCLPEFAVCPIVRLRGPFLDIGAEFSQGQATGRHYGNDFIMTGARAGFGRLVELRLRG